MSDRTPPTDLQQVLRWAKSNGPAIIYNAASRLLDAEPETERIRAELAEVNRQLGWLVTDDAAAFDRETDRQRQRAELAEAERDALSVIVERVRAERANIASGETAGVLRSFVAERLGAALDTPNAPVKPSGGACGGLTPQTLGASEGDETSEAQGASQ